MKKLIVIVEDEPDIVELISLHLERAGFVSKGFQNAENFFKFIDKQIPDLIILDLMLPDADGLEICKYLNKSDKYVFIPIIMLTAKSDETDKVLGLELGADDYVTKPFSSKELIARVKAVLRRKDKKSKSKIIQVSDILKINVEQYRVVVEGKEIKLTSTEFKILRLLASKKGRVFTRNNILDYLWGSEKAVIDRTVDVHIKNIREKLGNAKTIIQNVRGIGYRIEE